MLQQPIDLPTRLLGLLLATAAASPSLAGQDAAPPAVEEPASAEAGPLESRTCEHGRYWIAALEADREPRTALVVVHPTPAKDVTAHDVARQFAERWQPFAAEHGLALICPVFDDPNFGCREGPGGGYRNLVGRDLGADDFLIECLDDAREAFGPLRREILLYGHSAGGQFAARFLVQHPERIRAAVLSAAATYSFPNDDLVWPHGMRSINRRLQWPGERRPSNVRMRPRARNYLLAATLPVTVLVGAADTEKLRAIDGVPQKNRVERATAWAEAMTGLAERQRRDSGVQLRVVPEVDHNAGLLTPAAMEALTAVLQSDD